MKETVPESRIAARERIEGALSRGGFVTLTGAPGVGKSWLARRLPDWVVVSLGDLRGAGIRDRLAFALDVQDATSLDDAVISAMTEVPGIVLDDADHVSAEELGALIDASVDARIVVTSRSRVAHSMARVVELEPLSPAEALRFFEEQVSRVRGRELQPQELDDARALVVELEGNPAALLLAAARSRVLGARALRHRLRDPIALLRSSDGGSAEALVAWSWEALEPWEREALSQLCIFAGPFTMDDAEHVVRLDPTSVLDAVTVLRDRSMIVDDGSDALRLPHLVRAYVRARDPELPWVRLAEHLADALANELGGLARQHAHLVALMEHVGAKQVVGSDLAAATVEAAIVATPTLLARGPHATFARVLEPVLEVSARSGAPAALQARAFLARGRLRYAMGQDDAGLRDVRAGLTIATKLDDDALITLAALTSAELGGGALPERRPEGLLGLRWDAVRARQGDDVAAGRVAATDAPFLAAEALLLLAERGESAEHARRALALAERDEDEERIARALLLLGEPRDRLLASAAWAERAGRSKLADELNRAAYDGAPAAVQVTEHGFVRGDAQVSLQRRHALRRVFFALVDAKRALDWTDLLAAGWPGEQVRAESGAHRVRVAISTLRKLGLGDALETVEGGYRLNLAVEMRSRQPKQR